MNQVLGSQVLVQVFSLSPSAMLTLADTLRGEAVKKINQANDEEKESRNRAARKEALTSSESVMKLEELERLVEYTSIRAADLCDGYVMREILSRHSVGKSVTPSFMVWLGMNLYEAGRIDGIREERARRRAQKHTTTRPR